MTLLEQIRASIRECLDTRAGHMAVIDSVIAAAEARDDSALTDAETIQFSEARSAVAAADADLAQLQEREAELVALEEAREELVAQMRAMADHPSRRGER